MQTERTNYIKVNFPADHESYQSGNGEGMWVLVDAQTYLAYQSDIAGGVWNGTLANDSVYYPGELRVGDEVTFEMRGKNRPCAVWDGFLSQLRGGGKDEALRILMAQQN